MFHCTERLVQLAKAELEAANKEHPLFASPHEGYAVLLEEVEEAEEALCEVKKDLKQVWLSTRFGHDGSVVYVSRRVNQYALDLAAEAIQVAAMAQKMIDSLEGKHDSV